MTTRVVINGVEYVLDECYAIMAAHVATELTHPNKVYFLVFYDEDRRKTVIDTTKVRNIAKIYKTVEQYCIEHPDKWIQFDGRYTTYQGMRMSE